jgi:hypothetical protein
LLLLRAGRRYRGAFYSSDGKPCMKHFCFPRLLPFPQRHTFLPNVGCLYAHMPALHGRVGFNWPASANVQRTSFSLNKYLREKYAVKYPPSNFLIVSRTNERRGKRHVQKSSSAILARKDHVFHIDAGPSPLNQLVSHRPNHS